MATVLTIGSFDTPHLGHARLFQRCEELGELTVGVNSDAFIESYKGKRPLFNEQERMGLIANLGYHVVLNSSAGRECIEQVKPDYLVIGMDWLSKDYLRQINMRPELMQHLGISLVYVPYTKHISSTEMKRRCTM